MRLPAPFVFASLLAFAAPALSDEAYFKTPSSNIHCAYFDIDGGQFVRCDIREFTSTTPPRPADCDLDWGGAFEIAANSRRGVILCHGDTVANPSAATLAYGKTFKRGGISCLSSAKGLTCKNARGHGFALSKSNQRVF